MYYNIILNSLDYKNQKCVTSLSKLACENVDLIKSKTFPVIICRYATEVEKSFYEELKSVYQLDMSIKEIKSPENVFEVFNAELKQGEQEDIHLKERSEIINRLHDGKDVLEEKEICQKSFLESSSRIKRVLVDRKEQKNAKFKPVNWIYAFIIWGILSILFILLAKYSIVLELAISCGVLAILLSVITWYDYKSYKKKKEYYESDDYYVWLIKELAEQNHKKNISIHRIENLIDTLEVRTCLVLLPTEQRSLDIVKSYLKELNTLKSINEIFSLQ